MNSIFFVSLVLLSISSLFMTSVLANFSKPDLLYKSNLIHALSLGSGPYSGRNFSFGTSPFLETIFLGKLYDHLGKDGASRFENASRGLWKRFSSSFRHKRDELIVPSDYSDFFSDPIVVSSLRPTLNQMSLMWSGVGDLVPSYQALTNAFVMETSPIVGILNALMFCGSTTDPSGYNMSNCAWGDIINGTWMGSWVAYWAAASRASARLARGNLTIILGGNPTFRLTSFFGSSEIHFINAQGISNVNIMTAPSLPGQLEPELCGQGSLVELEKLLIEKGISPESITCQDQPPLLRFLRCAQSNPADTCLA